MKIQKKVKKNSLISFKLLKYQIYNIRKNYLQNINNLNLEIKQVLKVIYLYNIKKKKILFIGFPYNKFLSNQTNHLFLSKNMFLSNCNKLNNYDLIVFNKSQSKDEIIFKKFKSLNIPLILFGESNSKDYNINGIFSSKKSKNFCLFLIFAVIRKLPFTIYG